MALLAGHLPSPYETLTYYYGIYSSSYRGRERKECGKEMKNIARQALLFITSHQEIKKILKHIGEETERAPPLPSIASYASEDSYDWGDFPPDEAYFCDAEWGL